mgnify:FL=1
MSYYKENVCEACGFSYPTYRDKRRKTNACSNECRAALRIRAQPTHKVCKDCGVEKPATKFELFRGTTRAPVCNQCKTTRRRKIYAHELYGLDRHDFEAMCDSQNNCCAICAKTFTATPRIDHCHATGAIRGLLCGACNSGLGHFRDVPKSLQRAIDYLKKHIDQR